MATIPDLDQHLTPEMHLRRQQMLAQRQLPNLGFYDQLLVYPELFERISAVGTFVRYQSDLPARLREATILMVGVELSSQFEWDTHQKAAREAGLDDALIARIGARAPLDPELEELRQLVRHVVHLESVPQDLFDRLTGRYGLQPAVELVALGAIYRMYASLAAAFDSVMPGQDSHGPKRTTGGHESEA